MRSLSVALSIGALSAVAPVLLTAQRMGGYPRPSGVVGRPSSAPPASIGFGSRLPEGASSSRGTRSVGGFRMGGVAPFTTGEEFGTTSVPFGGRIDQRPFFPGRRLNARVDCRRSGCGSSGRGSWWGSTYYAIPFATQSATPAVIPFYYPVDGSMGAPVYARPVKPPAAPYDPTKSKIVIIGTGSDGGGGVMRVQPLADRQLRLTWLGTIRPVREVRVFVADATRRTLRSELVTAASPSADFATTGLDAPVAFSGTTVIFADGSTQTMLVPFKADGAGGRPPQR